MSEVRDIENSIINAAADKLVSLGVEGSQLSVAGKESKTQVSQGRKIMTLLKAYRRRSELSDGQVDSILYCLKYLSGQSSFPTSVPLVGKSSSSQIKLFSSIKFFDEGVLLGDDVTEVDVVGAGVSAVKTGNKVTITVTGGGGGAAAAGTWVDQGVWNGATNLFPVLGALGDPVKKGYTWENSNDTTTLLWIDGGIIPKGATIRALVDAPGQTITNWRVNY
ncbi:MAG: hypothetical protein ACK52I_02975 [Pseudomonadota bacterium]|jgi:hypothetical protein